MPALSGAIIVEAAKQVYAVAQGSLAIGGFQAEGEAAKITRGVPTVGRIANGAAALDDSPGLGLLDIDSLREFARPA